LSYSARLFKLLEAKMHILKPKKKNLFAFGKYFKVAFC